MKRIFPIALFFSLSSIPLLGGCGSSTNECNDGIDNDDDGQIDGNDRGCFANGNLESPEPAECGDGIDNDDDGLVDADDPDCSSADDNSEIRLAACENGEDDDNDGFADFPEDPGCNFPKENDESDDCPDGPNCPACSNMIDDDKDGNADYPSDTGCESAADSQEFDASPDLCGASVNLEMLPENFTASGEFDGFTPGGLSSPTCGGAGSEYAYFFVVDEPVGAVISTNHSGTTVDTVLYLRGDCDSSATELGCNDDAENNASSYLIIDILEPGPYYVVVDTYENEAGTFQLTVDFVTPRGGECANSAECAPGLFCRNLLPDAATETCQPPQCSDGADYDGDGKDDYPLEPGCESPEDQDESDDCPDGPNCPLCANGIDDDNDGFTDLDDPSCESASGHELLCGSTLLEVQLLTDAGVDSITPAYSDPNSGEVTPSCHLSSISPEEVWQYNNTRNLTSLTFTTTTPTTLDDTVLSVQTGGCGNVANELVCVNDQQGGESATVPSPGMQVYHVFVDGDYTDTVTYNLSVSGVLAAGAACDVSNTQFVCDSAGGYTCQASTCQL